MLASEIKKEFKGSTQPYLRQVYFDAAMNQYLNPSEENNPIEIFIETQYGIKSYIVIKEAQNDYICRNPFNNNVFSISKNKAFLTKDELKYDLFCKRLNLKKQSERIKFLDNSTQRTYCDRYIKDFPEKVI